MMKLNAGQEWQPEKLIPQSYKRQALIRGHWKIYGGSWDVDHIGPRLRIPIRRRVSMVAPTQDIPIPTSPVEDTFEFQFERGRIDGRSAYRITCENTVVGEGFL